MSIQALREQRSLLAKTMRDRADKNTAAWSPELQSAHDADLGKIDALDAQIEGINAMNDRLAKESANDAAVDAAERVAHDKKSPAAAMFAKWVRGGDKALNANEWADIRAAMSTTTGNQGGFSVQSDVAAQLIQSLKAFGGVREVATIITTEMGNPLSFPTSDGTAETGELIAENASATSADPTFGTVSLAAYKFSSKVVAVPIELLQDSQVDIEAFVSGRLAERIGRITNTYFTTGTATAQPGGIVTGATSGKIGTTGQTLTVIIDDLIDLVHSVDAAYRAGGNCSFMLNDSSMKVVRKLKDSTGRPIFMPGYDGLGNAMPDTILGHRVTINNDMAVMAANAKSIVFGDLSKYFVRDVVNAIVMHRFEDSAYAKLGQVGFLMWARAGGALTDSGAVKYYQNSAT